MKKQGKFHFGNTQWALLLGWITSLLLVVLAVELQKSELLVVLHCSPYQLLAARATLVARVDPIIKRQVAVAVLENPDILRLRCA